MGWTGKHRIGRAKRSVSPRSAVLAHISVMVITQNEKRGQQKIIRETSDYFSVTFFHCRKVSIVVQILL